MKAEGGRLNTQSDLLKDATLPVLSLFLPCRERNTQGTTWRGKGLWWLRVSDVLVPRLLGPRGLGRLLWWLEHVAKESSLGQTGSGEGSAAAWQRRWTHTYPCPPTAHLQCILVPGPQCFNSWSNPRSYDTTLCLVEKNRWHCVW